MKLNQLLQPELALSPVPAVEITALCRDSRAVTPGCAFVCIRGTGVDSHAFAADAAAAGAAVVIVERDRGLPNQVLVADSRAVWAQLCAAWFGYPSRQLRLVGITGTNGKTSTAFLLKAVLEAAGHTVGLIGTIQNMIGPRVVATGHTTPDPFELQQLLAEMVAAGCDMAVMEVSSHALHQARVGGCHFAVGAFTNLTQDHLDYHGTMEDYAAAKRRLFGLCERAVLNADDPWSEFMGRDCPCPVTTYSAQSDAATYTARNPKIRPDGVSFELLGTAHIGRVRLKTPGQFAVYNGLCAAACARALGVPFDTVVAALSAAAGIKGRAEVVPTDGEFTVVIDYAHTPDGLKNICETLNACKAGRLITVFGCGGDRDRTKRPLMGAMAAALSDYVVVTSDNPRSEEPGAIIADILAGMADTQTPYIVVENRVEAIHLALHSARPGDTVLLAGKGHEAYQILKDGTIHLDEREVVAAWNEGRKNGNA